MDGTSGSGAGGRDRGGRRRWGLKPTRQRHDDALSRVHHEQFEHLMADHFRSQGWQVDVVGAAARGRLYDGGIDLKLRRDGQYVVVQCKQWTANQVTHNAVHELLGVMQTERATGAILVTSGEFTDAARSAAVKSGHIRLLDGAAVRPLLDPAAIERALHASEPMRAPRMLPADNGDAAPLRRRRASPRTRKPPRGVRVIGAVIGSAVLALMIVRLLPTLLHPQAATAAAATAPAQRSPLVSTSPSKPVAIPTAYDLAGHLIGAQAAALAGADQPSRAHLKAYADGVARNMRIPDASRPIDHESARAVVGPLTGVRSAIWLDRANLAVMVDGQPYRTLAMIDTVCDALAPLGDTLAVVVHVQDATAKNGDGAMTLSRNCQLPVGERALLQEKRQVDVIAPEVREAFKRQQAGR